MICRSHEFGSRQGRPVALRSASLGTPVDPGAPGLHPGAVRNPEAFLRRSRLDRALRKHRREPDALGARLRHRRRAGKRPRACGRSLARARPHAQPDDLPQLRGAQDRHAASVHALVRGRRHLEDPDHSPRLLLPDLHQRLLWREVRSEDSRLVRAQPGCEPLPGLLQGGGAERPPSDLRRAAGVAGAVLHRDVRRRNDQRRLWPRTSHPRRRKRAAVRSHVCVPAQHRDPRLPERLPPPRHAHPPPHLARAGRVSRLVPFVLIGAALAGWEIMARSGLWSPLLFPSLANIGYAFAQFFSRTDRLLEAWTSLHRALGGFALAAVTGVVIGMLMGRSAFVAGLLDPLFSGTYAVPKLALFPIFIFAFGIGSLSKVALVFLECLYPIVIITSQGARGVDRVLLWSAQNMGASRAEILRQIGRAHV